ncbi:MAG: hypothetical protein G8D24_01520 [Buchnera aphidicola (Periphyllus lyropictus)]|nr:hypothetical protein [Buchnera aphidicola (Periphyllus lyropictus)]
MDKSLSLFILDIFNRLYLNFQVVFKYQKVGNLST